MRNNTDIGLDGELAVLRVLLRAGRPFLHSLFLPDEAKRVVEIDIVALVSGALLVMEVKAHAGRIHVIDAENWIQTLPGRPPRSFYNPLQQNRRHVEVVRACVRSVPVLGAVVFSSAPAFTPARPSGVFLPRDLPGLCASIDAQAPRTDAAQRAYEHLRDFYRRADRSLLSAAHQRSIRHATSRSRP